MSVPDSLLMIAHFIVKCKRFLKFFHSRFRSCKKRPDMVQYIQIPTEKAVAPMDQYPIKTVTFGGFDKQDVIQYIEQAAAAQRSLQEELDSLKEQVSALRAENEAQRVQVDSLTRERLQLREELAKETTARQELEALKPLQAEVERLRPDAEAYAQFREEIGAIECEARKRAADLEQSAAMRLRQTVTLFQEQYQALMTTFEAAASHVTGELRKVEVNLTQLPRTMDQSGAELKALSARLEEELRKK